MPSARRSYYRHALFVAVVVAASAPRPCRAQRIDALRATRLLITRQRIEAEGRVRLSLGRCRLRAAKLLIDRARQRLELWQPELSTPGAQLSAARMRRHGRRGALELDHALLVLCGCRHSAAPPLRVRATRARISTDGARLHLSWPRLYLGRLPLLAAPYWAVALRPGVSGLLAPTLGYSARDGLRVALPVYLAPSSAGDLLLAPGVVQSRGVALAARVRVFASGDSGALLRVRALDDDGTLRASARGDLWLDGARAGTELSLTLDLLSDETLSRDLSRDPDRVFAPYARTRLAASWARGPVYSALVVDALERLQPPLAPAGDLPLGRRAGDPRPLRARAALRLALAPLPLFWGFFALGTVDAIYRSDALVPDAAGSTVPPRAGSSMLVELSPAIALARPIGRWLRLDAVARYRLQLEQRLDGETFPAPSGGATAVDQQAPSSEQAAHSARFGAELSLPLSRRFSARALRHVVAPFIGWQGAAGRRRLVEGGRELRLAQRHAALVGVRSQLWRAGRRLARAAVALLAGADTRRLAARLRLGTRHFLRLRGLFDLSSASARSADLEGSLCLAPGAARLCAGFVRQRLAALGELLAADAARWSSHSVLDVSPIDIPAADQLRFSLVAPLRGLTLSAAIAVDATTGRVGYARYGAFASFGCRGCYRLGATVLSRDGQRYDGLLELSIRPGAMLGCR